MIDPGLADRVVLITGANNPLGVGAAMARGFSAQQALVFLHYFRQPCSGLEGAAASSPGEAFYRVQQTKSAEELLPQLRSSGAKVEAREADLADAGAIVPLFDEAERLLGPVEIVVNNAAHWEADTFVPSAAELRDRLVELWTDRPDPVRACGADRLFAVNVRAPALIMAEFARGDMLPAGQLGGGSSTSAPTVRAVSPPRSATARPSTPSRAIREVRLWSSAGSESR